MGTSKEDQLKKELDEEKRFKEDIKKKLETEISNLKFIIRSSKQKKMYKQ